MVKRRTNIPALTVATTTRYAIDLTYPGLSAFIRVKKRTYGYETNGE